MQYVYQKDRRDFGRQCLFSDKNELVFSEPPNRILFKDYILRNPVARWTQKTGQLSAHEANTDRATRENKGVLFVEGGWPKDINLADPEQVVRYRRKIEKDESYIVQVQGLTKVENMSLVLFCFVNTQLSFAFESKELVTELFGGYCGGRGRGRATGDAIVVELWFRNEHLH